MAMRRSRSLSLFQPGGNSTARLEGLVDSDEDGSTKESNTLLTGDVYDNTYESEEEEEIFPNGQISTKEGTENDIFNSDLAFVRALKLCTNDKDVKTFKKTLRTLKFDKIDELKSINNDEIRAKFDGLLRSLGRFRTFYSVVHDMEIFLKKSLAKVKKHPEKPTAPTQPHSIFLKELLANGKTPPLNQNIFKWGSELYNKLSVHKKSHYIKKHEKMVEKYNRQLEDFYEKYPGERPVKKIISKTITPFNLYFDELRSFDKNCKRATALEQWKNLDVKNKVSYIKKAFQFQQNEASDKKKVTISNKEKMLLEEHNGKPEKPPINIYRLYMQESIDSPDKISNNSYRTLTKAEKQQLSNRLNDLIRTYEENMTGYIKRLKGETKNIEKEELLKFLSKCKLPETEVGIKSPEKNKSKRSAADSNDDAGEVSSPKNKKKSSTPKNINDDQAESVTVAKIKAEYEVSSADNRSPLKTIKSTAKTFVEERKKSKVKENKSLKTVAETHEEPELSPIKTEGVKKKSKKQPKIEKEEFTETKPPKTLFKYFVSVNSFGSLDKAKKKFRNLTKAEKKSIQKAYKNICELYIGRLREYLSSLEESEMKAFVIQMERDKSKEEDTDDGLTSSEDESDSTDSDSE